MDYPDESPHSEHVRLSPELFSPSTNITSFSPSSSPVQQSCSSTVGPPAGQVRYIWGEVDGTTFYSKITAAYEVVIHWRPNLFIPPLGTFGNKFVGELAKLFQAFADGTSLGYIAMKAITVQQQLLLQKPSRSSKHKDHVKHLQRRLDLWQKGDIDALLCEGQTLQSRLRSRPCQRGEEDIARCFGKYMKEGKVHAALNLLKQQRSGRILKLDDKMDNRETVCDVLKRKHPPSVTPPEYVLQSGEVSLPHGVIFDSIDASLIQRAATRTGGAAGLSGLDAFAWRRLCISYKTASVNLCNAMAAVGRCLCTSIINQGSLSAFVACRLIPIDKCPGVRPIGIGEVPRRIISKAILWILSKDIVSATGPLQTCAGQVGGCEAAIHAMRRIFQIPSTEGVLLIDAENAFNRLNRSAALHNIKHLCPSFSTVLSNTYQASVRMVIPGSGEIASHEGTTQGDPLAMAMYALAVTPLIRKLHHHVPTCKQVWYADDSSAAGTLTDLKTWWDELSFIGPGYGYFPNSSKTYLIVKPQFEEQAKSIFAGSDIKVTTDGHRHLGAVVGSDTFRDEYVKNHISEWINEVRCLSKIAKTQPHPAYAAFTHGLTGHWSHILRTIPNISQHLSVLEDVIHQEFIPVLTNRSSSTELERKIFGLPVRLGGLGLMNPAVCSDHIFQFSNKLTNSLVDLIVSQKISGEVDTESTLSAKREIKQLTRLSAIQQASALEEAMDHQQKRLFRLSKEKGSSSWLTCLPIEAHGFYLNKGEFRDALCLRYGWIIPDTPLHCICGKNFEADHALSCKRGGFMIQRHNELRDFTATLLTEVCHNVTIEPLLQTIEGETFQYRSANTDSEARLDICARGFWNRGQDAFFDVRVFNPNAPGYRSQDLTQLYQVHEQEKKRAYNQRVLEVENGVFTPLVFSTSSGMGREASEFYKRLADRLSEKRDKPYCMTMGWLRCCLNFALLRSAILCIRGSRSSKHHPFQDTNIELASKEGRLEHDSIVE